MVDFGDTHTDGPSEDVTVLLDLELEHTSASAATGVMEPRADAAVADWTSAGGESNSFSSTVIDVFKDNKVGAFCVAGLAAKARIMCAWAWACAVNNAMCCWCAYSAMLGCVIMGGIIIDLAKMSGKGEPAWARAGVPPADVTAPEAGVGIIDTGTWAGKDIGTGIGITGIGADMTVIGIPAMAAAGCSGGAANGVGM
jgi:hypothetical protein